MTYYSGSVQLYYDKMGWRSGIVVRQKERALRGSYNIILSGVNGHDVSHLDHRMLESRQLTRHSLLSHIQRLGDHTRLLCSRTLRYPARLYTLSFTPKLFHIQRIRVHLIVNSILIAMIDHVKLTEGNLGAHRQKLV